MKLEFFDRFSKKYSNIYIYIYFFSFCQSVQWENSYCMLTDSQTKLILRRRLKKSVKAV